MSTEKLVNNSLFGKTELASEKIELGLVQDFEKLTNDYFTQSGSFEKSVQKVESSIKEMQDKFINLQKSISTLDSQYQKLRKTTSELGLEIPVEVENNYKKSLAILKNDFETFNKYNK
jgi:phage shock protein A